MFLFLNFFPRNRPSSKAHALVGEGLMDALVDLERLGEYWHHMLSDFPAHPAASDPGHALPISLYGFLAMKSIS